MQSRQFSVPELPGQIQVLSSLLSQPGSVPVILVVDASGSMASRAESVITSVQKAIETFKNTKDGRNYFISIIQFNHLAELTMPFSHVLTAPEFCYKPDGNTRLYSTVYEAVAMVIAACDNVEQMQPEQQITLAVFSDGDDNASQSSDLLALQGLTQIIRELQATVQLQTFGIGIDAERLAAIMGFPLDMAITVEGSPRGVEEAMADMTSITTTLTPQYAKELAEYRRQVHGAPPVPPPPPAEGVDHTLGSSILPPHKDNLGTDMDPMQSLYGDLS